MPPRNIAFVTGTRAEFGLMHSVLRAIQSHPDLNLQIIVTGMHLDRAHGRTIDQIKKDGWKIAATIPWKPAGANQSELARQTGLATAALARAFEQLQTDIVLVVGDRVEAFAAATAAHLSGRVLAHIHGGDRALGQVDDVLRHAITKLAHLHFPATHESADRIQKLGEDSWRIKLVGSPGIDGITKQAMPYATHWPITLITRPRRFALFVLHPTEPDNELERRRANLLLAACVAAGFEEIVCIYPNNDPGAAGIIRAIDEFARDYSVRDSSVPVFTIDNYNRDIFLGVLRDAALLIGNSSSGIIEAASFGTPVIDVGDRQKGRQRGPNVASVPFNTNDLRKALAKIWNNGKPPRFPGKNPYGRGQTGVAVARHLSIIPLNDRLRRKLIAY